MIDVSQSRWIQGIKSYVKENKAKYKKVIVIETSVALLISIVFFVVDFVFHKKGWCIGGIVFLIAGTVHFFMNYGKANKVMKHLENMVQSKMEDEQNLEQFDEEILNKPKSVVENKKVRYLFTEHYIMLQNKKIEKMVEDQLIYLPEIEKMDILSYNDGSIAYSCLFYHKDEKKAFSTLNFNKKSFGKEFLAALKEALKEVKPELLQQNEYFKG